MGRGWKRAEKIGTAPVPYPTVGRRFLENQCLRPLADLALAERA